MKIAIGADHRGYGLKEEIKKFLEGEGHEVVDAGTDSNESVDYPVYARKVAGFIQNKEFKKGILVCASGIGVCIAANKFRGIRAANVMNEEGAELASSHNNANILCLGADFTGFEQAKKIVEKYLNTVFEGGRHQRRVDLIAEFETEK